MSIRGTVTIECDQKKCAAEEVIDAEQLDLAEGKRGLTLAEYGLTGWHMDDDGQIWCPQCAEPNPRERGDDDGVEYADPGDRLAGRE